MSSRRRAGRRSAVAEVVARADAPETVTTTQAAPAELLQFDFEAELAAPEAGANTRASYRQTAREASIKDAIIRWLDQQI